MKTESPKPENIAKEWLELKNQKLVIESRLDELKLMLESYLIEQPENQALLCNHNLKLVSTERESFKLSAAKKKIAARILKPYITVSTFNQIRTTFCGEEKEAA